MAEQTPTPRVCDCICHRKPGVMHIAPCCGGTGRARRYDPPAAIPASQPVADVAALVQDRFDAARDELRKSLRTVGDTVRVSPRRDAVEAVLPGITALHADALLATDRRHDLEREVATLTARLKTLEGALRAVRDFNLGHDPGKVMLQQAWHAMQRNAHAALFPDPAGKPSAEGGAA